MAAQDKFDNEQSMIITIMNIVTVYGVQMHSHWLKYKKERQGKATFKKYTYIKHKNDLWPICTNHNSIDIQTFTFIKSMRNITFHFIECFHF
jgi:hypothetical protein